MKQPLVPVALCYVAGLLLANGLPLPLAGTLAAGIAVGLLALLWERGSAWLLGLTLGLAGAANLTLHTAVLAPHDLRNLLGGQPELVTLQGRLCETPAQRIFERDETESWRTVAQVDVRAVRIGRGPWQPAFGRIAANTPGTLPDRFFGGQAVAISGVLAPPKPALAEGLFDYRAYLRRQGIHFQLKVAAPDAWEVDARSAKTNRPWADRFCAWARATLAHGLPEEDEPLRLLWAMTLGWKTALTDEVSEPFMRSGTMHIFAISGLHIALIAGILVAVLRVLKVPRSFCGLLVIPLLWLYTGATGWQSSAIRSTVMMTVVIAGWSLRRPSNLLNSLAAAALIILFWEPQQIFQASFQLSFCVVLSLALLAPGLGNFHKVLLNPVPGQPGNAAQEWARKIPGLKFLFPDPFLPAELQTPWRRWVQKPLVYLFGSASTSLAAWLGSIPLIAAYFHLFTPVALLANLVIVPLAGAALASCLASLATGGWFPAGAELFNHSAWFWMKLMVGVSEEAARLPGAWTAVDTPQLLTFALYYGTLASLMAGWLTRPRVRVAVATILGVLAVAWVVQWQSQRAATRLTVLPLNGGHAVFVGGKHGEGGWLIDCGDESSVQFVTQPYLQAQGLERLRRLLLTHGDVRHTGGAQSLLESIAVDEIVLSPVRFRSPTYRTLSEQYAAQPARLRHVRRGDRLGPWTVLHPGDEKPFSQADDNAIVLRGEFDGSRVLLLSDLGKAGQNALMQHVTDLRADILVSGLPSQGEPLADDLLRVIRPKLMVIADADYPAPARATPALRDRLARQRVPVIYTREAGTVTLDLRRHRWRVSLMSDPTIYRSDP